MIENTVVIVCVVITAVILTELLRRYALKKELVDIPNSRSSHSEIIPRGGGASIVVTFLVSLVFIYYAEGLVWRDFMAFLGAGLIIAGIGFWDDHDHVPAPIRLACHFLASIWVLGWLGELNAIYVLSWPLPLGWLGWVIASLFLVWLINLYNFMDGIDGIASVETIFVALSAAFFLYINHDAQAAFSLCLLAAACFGFLVWNWPPAKIFMGDVASGFLGVILGVYALVTSSDNTLTIWTWLILLGVFIVDATYTLVKRMYHSERWYEAHRCHAYQFAALKCGSHKFVTLCVLTLNILWLFPIALFSVYYPGFGFIAMLVAYLPLVGLAILTGAGKRIELNKFIREVNSR